MVPKLPALTARVLLLAVIFYPSALLAEVGDWRLQPTAPVPSETANIHPTEQSSTHTPETLAPSTSATATTVPPSSATALITISSTPPSATTTPGATITSTDPSSTAPSATSEANTTPTDALTATTAASSTARSSPAPTITNTATEEEPPPDPLVIINEVAWSGTLASAFDEWIELHNPNDSTVSLDGWRLTDGGDINVVLSGSITAHGYYLLERTDDTTIGSVVADLIYTGALRNSGEVLQLFSPAGSMIDTANESGGAWLAGNARSRASMQRLGSEWITFSGIGSALDRDGNLVPGTPRQVNSSFRPTPTISATPIPTFTPSPSATPTATMTLTPSPTPSPTAAPEGIVLINELAWAGSSASASDEWIELYNTGAVDLDITGWRLTDGGDIDVVLSGRIAASGYYLMERTDDTTIVDLDADLIYHGSLRNGGERVELFDSFGRRIDAANSDGGSWPAGEADSRASMERRGGLVGDEHWGSFTGYGGNGRDAEGRPIAGTPKAKNSIFFPTPTPTWIPGSLVINEVLIRPHYDWEGDGEESTGDEFIELFNRGPRAVKLEGWILDDVSGSGSRPFVLPRVTIANDGYAVFFRSQTHIALNDSGDSVRLLAPNGRMIDKIHYLKVRAYNLSYGRLPSGSNQLAYGLWPTPGKANLLFVEPEPTAGAWPPRPAFACHQGGQLRSLLPRVARWPWQPRLMIGLGLTFCYQN